MKLTLALIVYSLVFCSWSVANNDLSTLLDKVKQSKSTKEKHEIFTNFIPQLDRLAILEQAKFWHEHALNFELEGALDKSIEAFDKSIELLTKPKLMVSEQLIYSYTERAYIKYLKYYDPQYYCPDRKIALIYARQIDNPLILAKSLINMVFCQTKPEDFIKGTQLLDEAISLAEQHNLPPRQHALIYNASYDLYRKNQIHAQSYEFLLKAIEMWEKVNDYADIFNMTHNLVTASIQMQNLTLAKQHVDALFQFAKRYPNRPDFQFFAYLNKTKLHISAKQWLLTKDAAEKTILLEDKTQEKFFVKSAYKMLAISHARLNNFQEAHKALTKLRAAFPEEPLQEHLLKAILAFHEGKYSEAVAQFFLEIDKEKNSTLSFVNLSSASTAASYNQRFVQLDQTILKKELEIKTLMLKAELKNKQIMYLSLSALLIITLTLFVILYVLNRARRKFKIQSKTDYLTGIYNRRAFIEEVELQLKSTNNNKLSSAIIIFDVDNFKLVNDTFGHDVGDKAIIHIVKCSLECISLSNIFGRIGGEEFALFLPQTSLTEATAVCEAIRQSVESKKLCLQKKGSLHLSVSLGCTLVEANETLAQALKRADNLLYQAKENGRNNTIAA